VIVNIDENRIEDVEAIRAFVQRYQLPGCHETDIHASTEKISAMCACQTAPWFESPPRLTLALGP
jgi:hypothetical protein